MRNLCGKPIRRARGRHARRGETLTETLVGMLIVAAASAILMGGIAAAARISRKAAESKTTFSYAAAAHGSDGAVTVTPGGGTAFTLQVTQYTDGTYYWYAYQNG